MNKYIHYLLFFSLFLVGGLFLLDSKISAQVCPGGYCQGYTTLDVAFNDPQGCTRLSNGWCKTNWYNITQQCGADCTYSNLLPNWCDQSTCRVTYGHAGTCCVNSSGPSPSPGSGSGGGGVPAGNCNASCYSDADCAGGLVCHGEGAPGSGIAGVCRNSSCTSSTSCSCGSGAACNRSCDLDSQCPSGMVCQTNLCRNAWCRFDADCTCNNPVCRISVTFSQNNILPGGITEARANVSSESNGGIDDVTFRIADGNYARFTSNGGVAISVPRPAALPFRTNIDAINTGSVTVSAQGNVRTTYGTQSCSAQATLFIDAPPSPGIIQARAVSVPAELATCTEINNPAATKVNDTVFGFSNPAGIPNQTQTADQYVVWNNLSPANYTLTAQAPAPPPEYILSRMCWSSTDSTSGEGATANLTTGSTLTYNVGFSQLPSWTQVVGGNLTAGIGSIDVTVPAAASLAKSENATDKSPVVTYGNTINTGNGTVSPDGYAVEDNQQTIPSGFSYYNYYDGSFGPKTTLPATNQDPIPAANTVGVYASTGDLTVTGTWDVEPGQKVVVFVPGNLTISTNITVASGGFLAFIVQGNISVSTSVGQTTPLANPNKFTEANVSGIYIADGNFQTLSLGSGLDKQLILAGTFVANSFSLSRDLGANNQTYPAEQFVYRADLWANAPRKLKEVSLVWEEVAP